MLTKTTTDLRKQQILEAFAFRHATKRFADKQIPEDDFAFILETGRLSPSSFGYEPWHFLVIQDESLRARLAPFAWGAAGQLETASHFVILLARNEQDMHFDAPYINHMMQDVIGLTPEAQKGRYSFYRSSRSRLRPCVIQARYAGLVGKTNIHCARQHDDQCGTDRD